MRGEGILNRLNRGNLRVDSTVSIPLRGEGILNRSNAYIETLACPMVSIPLRDEGILNACRQGHATVIEDLDVSIPLRGEGILNEQD